MKYLVIYDDCGDGNTLYLIDESDIDELFTDMEGLSDEEGIAAARDYKNNLVALDGQFGGSTDIDPALQEFLTNVFVDDCSWAPINTEEPLIIDSMVRIIQTGWIP